MTEKELVEKLKAGLRKWADTMKEDLEAERKADLVGCAEIRKGELEKLYQKDFERHNKMVLQIDEATKFKQLTDIVRDFNWDAQSWIEFVFEHGFESKIEIGNLSNFDT